MIVLAREASDGLRGQPLLDRIDVGVRRNGYGRQASSFEAPLDLPGDDVPFPGVFIRAPRIERLGEGVEVVAALDGEPVAVRQGPIMVTAFHPELTGDARLHRRFLDLAREAASGAEAA
jgi:5'-phosphate synthase pdxT subunit